MPKLKKSFCGDQIPRDKNPRSRPDHFWHQTAKIDFIEKAGLHLWPVVTRIRPHRIITRHSAQCLRVNAQSWSSWANEVCMGPVVSSVEAWPGAGHGEGRAHTIRILAGRE